MEPFDENASTREVLKAKLRENFDGRIVRKDLTKKIKEGANVPVYVLEFLLGQYCSSDDEEVIEKGVFWRIILSDRMRRRRFCHCFALVAATRSSTRLRFS